MASAMRDILARTVARHRPELFFYKADRARRAALSVSSAGGYIDVAQASTRRKVRIARANAVYVVDMLNAFDYYFDSAAPIEVRERGVTWRIVDFSTPRFQQVAGFADFPILCPSLTEPFVTAEQYLDFAQLKPGDVVLDLGSYSGLTSIAFSKAVGPAGRVIALEPDPVNHAAARTNIEMHRRLNTLDNIVLMQAAVSDVAGFLDLSSEGAMGSAVSSVVGNYRGRITRVESLTLMDLVERNRLDRVDFIKMDIEGSEEAVLRGGADLFRRHRPRVIVEPHIVGGELSDKVIYHLLGDYGYRCETIAQIGVELPLVTGVPR